MNPNFAKYILFITVAVIATVAQAQTQDEPKSILGVLPGRYVGLGNITSQTWYVPSTMAITERTLIGNTITVRTRAYLPLAGIPIAEVKELGAQLEVQDLGGGRFDLLDLTVKDHAGKSLRPTVGGGSCQKNECTFTATILNGELRLTETWEANSDGFYIKNGSQTLDGLDASYEAQINYVGLAK